MKAVLKNYNEELLKNLLLKNKSLIVKIVIIFIYLLLGVLILTMLEYKESILLTIGMICGFLIYMYIVWMIAYVLMVAPEKYIFNETIEICKRVEKIFKRGFDSYDTYLVDREIPNINHLIDKSKLPNKQILSIWKYKLSSRKETFQITLPVVALMFLSIFNIPIKEDVINILRNYFKLSSFKVMDIKYLKLIVQAFSYPYLFVVYYSNIDRINSCISKIELLKDISNTATVN